MMTHCIGRKWSLCWFSGVIFHLMIDCRLTVSYFCLANNKTFQYTKWAIKISKPIKVVLPSFCKIYNYVFVVRCDQGGHSGQKGLYSAYKEHTDCHTSKAYIAQLSVLTTSTVLRSNEHWLAGRLLTKYAGNKHPELNYYILKCLNMF